MKNLKRTVAVLLSTLLVSALLPTAAYASGRTAVTTDALNFRAEGSVSGEVIRVIPEGGEVEVLATEGKWAHVSYKGQTGWVFQDFIVDTEAVTVSRNITSLKETELKAKPESGSRTLKVLKAGSVAALQELAGDWYKVVFDGEAGYVRAKGWVDAPSAPKAVSQASTPREGTYELFNDTTVYMNAFDAKAVENAVGTYKAGEYHIYKNFSGMINITRHQLIPGAWINPGANIDTTPAVAEQAEEAVTEDGSKAVTQSVPGLFEAAVALDTYLTADEAANRINAVGRYEAGTYFIFREHSGMLNLTKTEGVPGAWINPEQAGQEAPPAEHPDTIVSISSVNLREGAGSTYPAVTTIPAGASAVLKGIEGSWLQVEYQGQTGYTHKNYWNVPQELADKFTRPQDHPDTIVSISSVNLREGASSAYPIVRNVLAGSKAVLKGIENSWLQVEYQGQTGYTHRNYWNVPQELADKFTRPQDHPNTILSSSSVNMREGAGNSFKIMRSIPQGSKAVMTGKEGSWLRIDYNGQIGYSYMNYWDVPDSVLAKYTEADNKPKSNGHKVYLDPGHMGTGMGAVAVHDGKRIDENTINYRVAVLTKDILEKRGYTVYISKKHAEDPVDLLERSLEANALGADIFVSIHTNAFTDRSVKGTIGFWAGQKNDPTTSDWMSRSRLLSQLLAKRVGNVMGAYKAVSDSSYGISYSVNRNSSMPSTLLELGFITNYHDALIMDSSASQKDIAREIADGIDEYFKK